MQRSRWFRRFLRRAARSTATSQTKRRRIAFETLEDRRLLAVDLISRPDPSLVSDSAGGVGAFAPFSNGPGLSTSADGRYVAFLSSAPNLVAGFEIAPGFQQVYRYDRLTGEMVLVSINSTGTGSGNHDSVDPVISADGRVVAFQSRASNLHVLDRNILGDIFARDLSTSTTHLVSINSAGTAGGEGFASNPVMSADGRVVAFKSTAEDMHPLDTESDSDIFARDLSTNTTYVVSINSDGTAFRNDSSSPAISADGRVVAFESGGVFARDLGTNATYLVSTDTAGTALGGGHNPVISADGRLIAFESANRLHPLDNNDYPDVYVRDLLHSTTRLVSVNTSGTSSGNNESSKPVISANGRVVAFVSKAALHQFDSNRLTDVYAHDLSNSTTQLVSINYLGGSGSAESSNPAISADGSVVAFLERLTELTTVVQDISDKPRT
jgi:Tol biopolymer transport system component